MEWAPFLIAKARRLVELDALEEAEATLEDLDLASRRSYNAWQVRALMAEASEDVAALAVAETEMRSLEDHRWSALQWNLRYTTPQLFMVPATAGRGLRLEVIEAGVRGGDAVQVYFDGELVALQAMATGQSYDVMFDISPQPHLLQVVSASGQATALGSVTLLP